MRLHVVVRHKLRQPIQLRVEKVTPELRALYDLKI